MADTRVFPWAADYDDDQLAAFIDDLWGAASGDDDLKTLDAIEQAIAQHQPAPVPCPITAREAEILCELANGLSYEEAGPELGISPNTVRRVVGTIYTKLGVRNGTQAAAVAAHHGWLPGLRLPDPPPRAVARGPRAWRAMYREHAAWMRERPGVPVDIGPYSSQSSARQAACRIDKGLLPEFTPAGHFSARHARAAHGGRWIVRAQYVGHQTTGTNTAERTAS
ncbi:response regulator transcription factor [Streptomyces canus]|uniref:response regulator transcription factor n=1 Tax=Streptomyces canus TaxID=58343 RepID=UPI003CED70C3